MNDKLRDRVRRLAMHGVIAAQGGITGTALATSPSAARVAITAGVAAVTARAIAGRIRTLGERGTEVLTVIAAGTGATAIAACGTQAGVTPEWFVSGAGLSAACGLGILCWVTW